jgi:hypothetical protein
MASVLETFLILFESNAEEVDKGSQEAKKSTDDLERSIKSTDIAAGSAAGSFLKMATTAAGALASVLSVGAVISAVTAAADNADALGEFSERLGVNIEDVSAWGDAVAVNGGTAEGFRASLDSLIDGMVTFATKGTSRVSPFFDELNIKMVDTEGKARDVMDVLPELADAFEGLSKQESAGLGRKLGLDQGTIMLLQRGRREVEDQIRIQKEMGVVTAENAEIAGKFNDQQDNTAKVFRSLFTIMGSTILPVFTKILSGLQTVGSFLVKHSDFMVGLLIAIGAAVAVYALPPLISMAVAAVAAFAPFMIMGAIIAGVAVAFALLYDDVMNFIDGNDSLIGQILDAYPAIGEVAKALYDVIMELWDGVKWVFDSILSILQISLEGWKLLFGFIGDAFKTYVADSELVKSATSLIGDAWSGLKNIGANVWEYMIGKITDYIHLAAKLGAFLKSVAEGISGALGDKKMELGITQGKSSLASAASSPLSSQTSAGISNSSKVMNKSTTLSTGPITVQTQATDAEGIAGAIGSSLGNQMRQTASTFDDGVSA